MIVAVVILIVEIAYFSILNNKIEEGLTAIPEIVDAYRDDFDKINEMAGKNPGDWHVLKRDCQGANYLGRH